MTLAQHCRHTACCLQLLRTLCFRYGGPLAASLIGLIPFIQTLWRGMVHWSVSSPPFHDLIVTLLETTCATTGGKEQKRKKDWKTERLKERKKERKMQGALSAWRWRVFIGCWRRKSHSLQCGPHSSNRRQWNMESDIWWNRPMVGEMATTHWATASQYNDAHHNN